MNKISIFIKYVLSVIVCHFMMTGCVEEFEADLPKDETHLLVVDGTICSKQHNEFHLTWSSEIKNEIEYNGTVSYDKPYDEALPVNGARVTICGTDGTEIECTEETHTGKRPKIGTYDAYSGLYEYYNSEYGYYYTSDEEEYEEFSYSSGVYSCDVPELKPDVSYYLTIEYLDDVYQSTPEKPIRTPDIETLEYFQKDSLSNVEVLLSTALPDDPNKTSYYTWNYSETWEVRPTRTTSIYFDIESMDCKYMTKERMYPKRGWKFDHNKTIITESTVHYDGGRFSRFQMMNIPRNDERISWCYCYDLEQRAISKAEYEYNMACRQAGWEMGGLFTPQPSALPTNIRCLTSSKKVIGYVGCSQNVVSKRMYIDGTKISRILPKPGESIIFPDCIETDCLIMTQNGMVLYSWSDGRQSSGGKLVTAWANPEDFDVRLLGATIIKPDYMPPFDEE